MLKRIQNDDTVIEEISRKAMGLFQEEKKLLIETYEEEIERLKFKCWGYYAMGVATPAFFIIVLNTVFEWLKK